MTEILPSVSPIDVTQLLFCPLHGHDLSCLIKREAGACDVQYKPSTKLRTRWDLFTDAVVEKMAWKAGRRVVMRPGSFALK